MENKQKTAVEWLIETVNSMIDDRGYSFEALKKHLEQAKQMEKEQIIKAYNAYYDAQEFFEGKYLKGEQYFNETFNQ